MAWINDETELTNDYNREFVRGFDWCGETVVDNFFANIDIYADEMSWVGHMLGEKLPVSVQEAEAYTIESSFDIDAHGKPKVYRRDVVTVGDWLRAKMLDYMMTQRAELITSMIEAEDNEADGQGEA